MIALLIRSNNIARAFPWFIGSTLTKKGNGGMPSSGSHVSNIQSLSRFSPKNHRYIYTHFLPTFSKSIRQPMLASPCWQSHPRSPISSKNGPPLFQTIKLPQKQTRVLKWGWQRSAWSCHHLELDSSSLTCSISMSLADLYDVQRCENAPSAPGRLDHFRCSKTERIDNFQIFTINAINLLQ